MMNTLAMMQTKFLSKLDDIEKFVQGVVAEHSDAIDQLKNEDENNDLKE